MSEIKAVIFDCFGVLYHGSLSYLLELTPPGLKEQMHDLSVSSDYGYVPRESYLNQAAQMVDRDISEIEAIIDARHVRHEEVFELLRSLKGRYKTGLLSNVGPGVMDRLFKPGEFEELFDVVVLSSDVGMIKPNPEVFEYIAQQLGVSPKECIMIDDLEKNCLGASDVGMQAIQYEYIGQLKSALSQLGVQ